MEHRNSGGKSLHQLEKTAISIGTERNGSERIESERNGSHPLVAPRRSAAPRDWPVLALGPYVRCESSVDYTELSQSREFPRVFFDDGRTYGDYMKLDELAKLKLASHPVNYADYLRIADYIDFLNFR